MGMKLLPETKGKVILYFPIVWMPQWPMWAPLCMYTLATALMHEGFEVILIDERVDPDPRDWLEAELQGALFVGIPGKSGGQCRNMEATAAFIKSRRPDMPVVAGGWFPSLFPDQTITSENIDIVIIGPADETLPEVANRILEKKNLEGIGNVFFKENGRVVKNEVGHLPRVENTKPIPWEIVGIKRYLHPHGWINYFTSRGCPGSCTFCSVYCLDPRRWTALPPERVIEDMEILVHKIGVRSFQILDTDFCSNLKRVESICRLILERNLKIRFHVLGRHHTISRIRDEQLELLRRAGCTEIEVGLETGSQRLSDWIRKQVKVDEFVGTIRRFVSAGIRMRVNIMVGLPNETGKDLASTFHKMVELRNLGDGVRFQMFRFTPLPDSTMGREVWAMKARGNQGKVPKTYRELLDFRVNDEPLEMFWISKRHERSVKRAYAFYAPLLFYKGAVDSAKGRPWWRFMLKCFMPLAELRLKHGFYHVPIEMWLNKVFGKRLPLGADSGVPPPEDVLPAPEMGQSLDNAPPLASPSSAQVQEKSGNE